jgi:CRISPR type I-D-associated protein Csc2
MEFLTRLLGNYTVAHPEPLIGAKTIQIILMREILDFTVLRTEETRELNTVATPRSISETENTMRVAFLGTKQKAVESRQLEQILRTATDEARLTYPVCYLKDNLCLSCPRCALFGATSTESGRQERANIKHRIEYSTAFSLLPFADVEAALTFNAINDQDQTTGQALGTRYAVRPATIFPSIVTLRSVTLTEFVLAIKALLACKSYGAESRIGGDVRNSVFGIVGGWEEVITSLELTLELYDLQNEISGETVKAITEKYINLTGNPDKVKVFSVGEVDEILQHAINISLTKEFLEPAYQDVIQFRESQTASGRRRSRQG